jgi:hypothetical protein
MCQLNEAGDESLILGPDTHMIHDTCETVPVTFIRHSSLPKLICCVPDVVTGF